MTDEKREWLDKEFIVEAIYQRKEFNRKDGTQGSVQAIKNEDDYILSIWDMDDMNDDLAVGDKYAVNGVTLKDDTFEGRTFRKWHTGKYSAITPLRTAMDKEIHYEKKINEEEQKIQKKRVFDFTDAKLDKILAQLQVIKDMI